MEKLEVVGQETLSCDQPSFEPVPTEIASSKRFTLKRLRGGFLLVIGYLLSPLCWWNDLIFNLPVAYAFGYLCRLISPEWMLPGLIAGYWLSNVVGILLMQFGAVDMLQGQPKERSLKKDLTTGVVSSTVYTFLIFGLVQLKIIDVPDLFSGEFAIDLGSLLPMISKYF